MLITLSEAYFKCSDVMPKMSAALLFLRDLMYFCIFQPKSIVMVIFDDAK